MRKSAWHAFALSGTSVSNRHHQSGTLRCCQLHQLRLTGGAVDGYRRRLFVDLREHRLAGSLRATFACLSRRLSAPSGYVLLAD